MPNIERSEQSAALEQQKAVLSEQIFQAFKEGLRPTPYDSRVSIKHALNWGRRALNIQAVSKDANNQITFKDKKLDSSNLPNLLIVDEVQIYKLYIEHLLNIYDIDEFVRQLLLVKYDSQLDPHLEDLVQLAFEDIINLLQEKRREFFDYPIKMDELGNSR